MSPADAAELVRRARRWQAADPDPSTRAALEDAIERSDLSELQELFGTSLEFGTAGLRAPLGPGPNRMNRLVVRRAAAAIGAHLLAHGAPGGPPLVVVGHDARHGSATFGADLVDVLAAAGIDVDHFDEPVPTPLLAFAVRARRAAAGIMVTASHNPATDNGLKVYAADGAQIVPPTDREIAAVLHDLPLDDPPTTTVAVGSVRPLGGPSTSHARCADGDVVEQYLARAGSLVADDLPSPLRVVHTSLHGVGDVLLRRTLDQVGGLEAIAVAAQQEPDPDFPGLASPNPEEPGTLAALLALADRLDADLALALDPDADRLAVALPDDTRRWRALTGDELGALLAAHLLATTTGPDRLVVTTIVSSRLVPAMCARAGVQHRETLTGFKWLCRPGIAHPEWRQVLLYEEALGYAVGTDARDKDGITAALVALHAIADWRRRGTTAWEVLDDLARRHGAHVSRNGSVQGTSRGWTTERLTELATTHPRRLGGIDVDRVDRPDAGSVRWYLTDDTRVIVRPSGTEPKVKYYVEAIEAVRGDPGVGADDAVGAARAVAAARLGPVVSDLVELLTR